ncbi:hypothetical protein Pryu01_00670 [Paraliobacillus ryukyuensis]|uniref:Uncharacterized protein DUF4190 n=1 Tax=Paraliobacillus ryukyuensis TaxID=200904 RepID=A0A366EFF7_9BACI|nr:DUF4190 domain-containing protein [Paraliobacillus ryukyuensis]RBP00756.1 uncharacterized protein DUF4190 [Paraliobacillus ryukyuensis]
MEEQNYYATPPQTSGKAIASMVLGILSIIIPYLGFILGIIAIVFAKKGMNETAEQKQGGRGMAIAGLTTGIIGTVLYGILDVFLIIVIFFTVSTPPTI